MDILGTTLHFWLILCLPPCSHTLRHPHNTQHPHTTHNTHTTTTNHTHTQTHHTTPRTRQPTVFSRTQLHLQHPTMISSTVRTMPSQTVVAADSCCTATMMGVLGCPLLHPSGACLDVTVVGPTDGLLSCVALP